MFKISVAKHDRLSPSDLYATPEEAREAFLSMYDDLPSYELQKVRAAKLSDLVMPQAMFSIMRERIAELGGTDDYVQTLEAKEPELNLVASVMDFMDAIGNAEGLAPPVEIVVSREIVTVERKP